MDREAAIKDFTGFMEKDREGFTNKALAFFDLVKDRTGLRAEAKSPEDRQASLIRHIEINKGLAMPEAVSHLVDAMLAAVDYDLYYIAVFLDWYEAHFVG